VLKLSALGRVIVGEPDITRTEEALTASVMG
jgi:hypothetical protein